jgi:hypothetical protein
MKIKKLPNSQKVIVEFDEVFIEDHTDLITDIAAAFSSVARRTAYNMWEFKTQEAAEQHMFMLKLKS